MCKDLDTLWHAGGAPHPVVLKLPWDLKGLHEEKRSLGNLERKELFGFIREGDMYNFKGFTKTVFA